MIREPGEGAAEKCGGGALRSYANVRLVLQKLFDECVRYETSIHRREMQAKYCRSCKSGQSEFGGLQHASCKLLHRFVFSGGSACSAGLNKGNSSSSRGPQARRA